MNLKLNLSEVKNNQHILISGSKSETNRLLLLQAQFPEITLKNASKSDDSDVVITALSAFAKAKIDNHQPLLIDVHHAGTAMRFLTAYFAIQPNFEVVITGSARMQKRPIKILVDALKELGANIEYVTEEGFPPLKIIGTNKLTNEVWLNADVSSQYISALLLIAPSLPDGLKLNLKGEITSLPYIEMTLALLNEIGIKTSFENNLIIVTPRCSQAELKTANQQRINVIVESDWSSASYFYSIIALSAIGTSISLSSFKKNSLQGDSQIAEIYKCFGVRTTFTNGSIKLDKVRSSDKKIDFDLNQTPDLAQTIAVTAFALGCECDLSGLQTLKIKETDRLQALKNELEKLGANVKISSDSIFIDASITIKENVVIQTYNDHRMAMAFAPLALKTSLVIADADVVSKSYPNFWEDLKSIGILVD